MNKVFVALSGGVDSSVAALLLKRAGFDVSGVFMKFWMDRRVNRENPCCSPEAERRARIVAQKLKIPFYVFDFKKEFKKAVVDYFLKQTKAGLTPNPCVVCNQEIKFGLMLKKSLELGADFVATGHYARTRREIQNPKSEIRNLHLLKAKDKEKDQSYFLWRLSQKQLSRVLFPVGDYTKKEVRAIAGKEGLPTAKTPESQNLCFLASRKGNFLKFYLKQKPGPIAEPQKGVNKIIGRHPGLGLYTIGQRSGIGRFLFWEYQSSGPYFVLKKDTKKNLLIVTKKEKDLFAKELTIQGLNWISNNAPAMPLRVQLKIRSRQAEVPAVVFKAKKSSQVLIKLKKAERAIAPGQSAVFYRGREVLGGGVII